jgi:hypothetical protein
MRAGFRWAAAASGTAWCLDDVNTCVDLARDGFPVGSIADRLRWNRLCDQLIVVPIHGGHVSMNSEELCTKLVQAVETSGSGIR